MRDGQAVKSLEVVSTAYGMQISAEKTQMITNNTNGISTHITIDNKKLETVRSCQYLGATVYDEVSKPYVLSRIAQTIAVVTKISHLQQHKHCHQLQGQTDAFPGRVHIFVGMCNVDHSSRHRKKNTGIGDKMFP